MFQQALLPLDFSGLVAFPTQLPRRRSHQFYLHYDLKLDFWALGWASSWGQGVTTVFGLLFGFIIGSYTDRFKGVRLMAPYFLLLGLVDFAAAFYVVDEVSLMIYSCAIGVINFAGGAIMGAFTIEVFPRKSSASFVRPRP